jgi:hypothetical protein
MKIKKLNEYWDIWDIQTKKQVDKPTEDDIKGALNYIKWKHNGEIPYILGKNEYARWMAEYANFMLKNKQ